MGETSVSIGKRPEFSSVASYILLFIFFMPLAQLLAQTIVDVLADPEILWLAVPVGRRLTLLVNSFGLAASVSISVAALGVLAGSYLLSINEGFWGKARWALMLTAPVPPYIHALTWTTAIRFLKDRLGAYGSGIPLSGFFMSYCVNVLAYLPLGVGLAIVGFMLVESEAVEAARLVKDDYSVFTEIILPLAMPTISTALGLVFILVVTDFSVPTLYSFNVYSLEVFSEFSASNSTSNSVLLSLPTLAATFAVLSVSIRGLRSTVQSSSVGKFSGFNGWRLPMWFKGAQVAAVGVCVAQLTLLVGGLMVETGSLQSIWFALTAASDDIVTTLIISVSGAAIGGGLGYLIVDKLEEGAQWWLLLSLPLALPSSLVGIGLIIGYNTWLPVVYGTMIMPVIAVITRFTSLAAIIVYAQKKKMDGLLFDAADLFEVRRNDALRRVKLPLQIRGIAAAALVLFAFSLGELGATLLVVPPGSETLTIRIFNYLHYGGSEEVAGLCLVMVITMMTLSGLAAYAYNLSEGKVK
ncbi:iron ABC transporter permease [Candidatus Bathyarchaeota archaeon]|nr:iron ABC transporter permease [Candidatus Bathyarchaeota archaeon]